MAEDMNDIFGDEPDVDGNIPQAYHAVQNTLDCFVLINYETALDAMRLHTGGVDAGHIRQQIVDIIRNNPPLQTVPAYFRDGRKDYLWYSDFYDDVPKDVFQQYNKFVAPDINITPANYATELTKIDLPYFRELVNLIVLEKLYEDAAASKIDRKETSEPTGEPITVAEPEELPSVPVAVPSKPKRSYEPKLTNEQCALVAQCIENINLFRRPISASQIKRLLKGKQKESLQVTNQPSFVCLFDKMMDAGYIKDTWMSVAVDNRDFTSFRRGKNIDRYGNEPHYLTLSQLTSRRDDNKYKYVDGQDDIEKMINKMREYGDR